MGPRIRLSRRYATGCVILAVVPALKGRPKFRSPLRGRILTPLPKICTRMTALPQAGMDRTFGGYHLSLQLGCGRVKNV